MVKDLKIKNSDLDSGTVDEYEELASIYKLLLRDISKSLKLFFRTYETYKKNHSKLGDFIYEASNKTGTDDWKKYDIKSKSALLDTKISEEIDNKFMVPIINKVQIVKLAEKDVKKHIREMKAGYNGLKKKLGNIQIETQKYSDLNKVLLFDIDTVKFLINRKQYD